jgi:hypothetical protein
LACAMAISPTIAIATRVFEDQVIMTSYFVF